MKSCYEKPFPKWGKKNKKNTETEGKGNSAFSCEILLF